MSTDIPRRIFLKAVGAGLLLPATGRSSAAGHQTAFQPPPPVVNRALSKPCPTISGVGCGIGFVPATVEDSRALDKGVHCFDTSRYVGDREKTFSGIIYGRDRMSAPYYMIYS